MTKKEKENNEEMEAENMALNIREMIRVNIKPITRTSAIIDIKVATEMFNELSESGVYALDRAWTCDQLGISVRNEKYPSPNTLKKWIKAQANIDIRIGKTHDDNYIFRLPKD